MNHRSLYSVLKLQLLHSVLSFIIILFCFHKVSAQALIPPQILQQLTPAAFVVASKILTRRNTFNLQTPGNIEILENGALVVVLYVAGETVGFAYTNSNLPSNTTEIETNVDASGYGVAAATMLGIQLGYEILRSNHKMDFKQLSYLDTVSTLTTSVGVTGKVVNVVTIPTKNALSASGLEEDSSSAVVNSLVAGGGLAFLVLIEKAGIFNNGDLARPSTTTLIIKYYFLNKIPNAMAITAGYSAMKSANEWSSVLLNRLNFDDDTFQFVGHVVVSAGSALSSLYIRRGLTPLSNNVLASVFFKNIIEASGLYINDHITSYVTPSTNSTFNKIIYRTIVGATHILYIHGLPENAHKNTYIFGVFLSLLLSLSM